jgi:hypothetical protein
MVPGVGPEFKPQNHTHTHKRHGLLGDLYPNHSRDLGKMSRRLHFHINFFDQKSIVKRKSNSGLRKAPWRETGNI